MKFSVCEHLTLKRKKSSFGLIFIPKNTPDTGLHEGQTGWGKEEWWLVEARNSQNLEENQLVN